MTTPRPHATVADHPLAGFIEAVTSALARSGFVRLVLAKPLGNLADSARRIDGRLVTVKGETRLALVATHATRDLTRHVAVDAAAAELNVLLAEPGYGHARLDTTTGGLELLTSRKGRCTLLKRPPISGANAATAPTDDAGRGGAHDRAKHRHVPLERPYLSALGVTDAGHRLVPAMARKWRQIDKFVELLDGALAAARLKDGGRDRIDVIDFGCGKGYLTFAAHDHLRHTLGLPAEVAGVELRGDLVAFCNDAVRRLGLAGLRFEEGDVRSVVPPSIDVMIALHACDTATDHAIATGVGAGAKVIMCSPCCHKELRPQLLVPQPLRPLLKHGIHLGQQAEMLTDALRALVLEACGYETRVFEFVALEHTQKNKMILATRRSPVVGPDTNAGQETAAATLRRTEAARQVDALKRYYGIREQCLERLLKDRLALVD